MFDKLPDVLPEIIVCLRNIGIVYTKLLRWDESWKSYSQLMSLSSSLRRSDLAYQADDTYNAAVVQYKRDYHTDAAIYYRHASESFENMSEDKLTMRGHCCYGLGYVYVDLGRSEVAIGLFRKAFD